MKTIGVRRSLLMSCIPLIVTACAAPSITSESGQLDQNENNAKIQLPKSYPCQNLHIKTGNCPPR